MKRLAPAALVLLVGAFLLVRWLGGSREDEVRLTGVVSANEAVVASELSGRLRELRVDEGDWVEKGQVVAVLAAEEIDAQMQSKLATIDQLSTRVEQDLEKVGLERARVTSQIEGATAQLRAAESQRGEFLAALEQAHKELERTRELVEQGLLPRERLDSGVTNVSVVESRLQAAGDRIAAAQAELELYQASERQVRVMAQQVEQTEAQIAQARAELEQISVRLGYTELKSPLSGMVSVRVAREGEFVAAGAPVVTIVDLSDVWVRAQVEETLVTRLVVGQSLPVRLASDEELTGRVMFISPEAEFATQRDVDRVKRDIRTFGIKVAVPNPDRRVHPGMTAYVILPASGELPEVTAPSLEKRPRAPATTDDAPTRPGEPTSVAAEASPEARPPDVAAPAAAASMLPEDETAAPPEDEPLLPPPPAAAERPAPRQQSPEPAPSAASTRRPGAREPGLANVDPSPEEVAEFFAGVDLENASEEELAQLEAMLLDATTSPPSSASSETPETPLESETPESSVENHRAAAEPERPTPPPSPNPNLPAWARPRPSAPPAGPPDPVSARSPETATPGEAALRLEGISQIDGRPVAIINGTRVFEGETVAGARVMSIAAGTVLLDLGGRRITLTF